MDNYGPIRILKYVQNAHALISLSSNSVRSGPVRVSRKYSLGFTSYRIVPYKSYYPKCFGRPHVRSI